jgi:hypothetical protein
MWDNGVVWLQDRAGVLVFKAAFKKARDRRVVRVPCAQTPVPSSRSTQGTAEDHAVVRIAVSSSTSGIAARGRRRRRPSSAFFAAARIIAGPADVDQLDRLARVSRPGSRS